MLEHINMSLVDWSRAQFALTAMYHWLFVPLTLGLSFIIAIMETFYIKTGDVVWKKITKFWMTPLMRMEIRYSSRKSGSQIKPLVL